MSQQYGTPQGAPGVPPQGGTPPRGNGWRTGFIVLAIVLGLAIVAAVVWGVIAATSAPAPAPTSAAPTPTSTPTPTPTPTPTSSPTPPPAAAPCTADDLSITLGQAEGAAGTSQQPLVFTNTASDDCTLQGFPQVAFVGDDNGTQLGAAAVPDGKVVAAVTLVPGDSVDAMLFIATAANYPNCTVQAANGFRVFPPNDSGAIFVPTTDYQACTNTDVSLLRIGSIGAGAGE